MRSKMRPSVLIHDPLHHATFKAQLKCAINMGINHGQELPGIVGGQGFGTADHHVHQLMISQISDADLTKLTEG